MVLLIVDGYKVYRSIVANDCVIGEKAVVGCLNDKITVIGEGIEIGKSEKVECGKIIER